LANVRNRKSDQTRVFSDTWDKEKKKGEITGWNIDMLNQNPETLEKAKEEYLF
jgi:hypothetical protein